VIREKVQRHPQIEARFQTEVVRFNGAGGKLKSVTTKNKKTGASEEMEIPGAFVFIGQEPNTAFLVASKIRLDRWGYVLTGHDLLHSGGRLPGYEEREPSCLETSIPGVFAAGDVRAGSTKQVASASGEGATAALLTRQFLKTS
jgi:thioredoxin reductase (NADPH)